MGARRIIDHSYVSDTCMHPRLMSPLHCMHDLLTQSRSASHKAENLFIHCGRDDKWSVRLLILTLAFTFTCKPWRWCVT